MTINRKRVGVIGGMGPLATIDFMSTVMQLTDATRDQDHLPLLVDQDPTIPDRQLAIAGEGIDPGPALAASARRLEEGGAEFLVMPCNLAHAWQSSITSAVGIPFISIVDVSVTAVLDNREASGPIGLLTTPGCFAAGLYQRAIQDQGREQVLQSSDEQAQAMQWVRQIKRGDQSDAVRDGLHSLATALIERGAGSLIAACTEFPLFLDQSMFAVPFVSSTYELAKATVTMASIE